MRRRAYAIRTNVREVECCEKCPLAESGEDALFFCKLEDREIEANFCDGPPPSWCPLRKGTFRLALKVTEQCLACEYFVKGQTNEETEDGECREQSPKTVNEFGLGIWPSVPPTAWCASFSPKE